MADFLPQGTSQADYSAQGKSNNFLAAQAAGRLTAGQAARYLTKKLGVKVAAKQLEPLAREFHHAGRFGQHKAARVFFFTTEQLDQVTAEQLAELAKPVFGWATGFEPRYDGPYGRKRYVPVIAQFGEFTRSQAFRLGDKFHAAPAEEMPIIQAALAAGNKVLPAFCNDWRQATRG